MEEDNVVIDTNIPQINNPFKLSIKTPKSRAGSIGGGV